MEWYKKSKVAGRFRKLTDNDKNVIYTLRDNPTEAEKALWEILKNKKLKGYKFRRQHKIGRFVVDFFCHKGDLIIEADGTIHDNRKEEDERRSEWLTSHGFKVIRFTNEEILFNIDRVKEKILLELS
jgi:5-methyltetrahydrofolate--homocysteine methyltransferase